MRIISSGYCIVAALLPLIYTLAKNLNLIDGRTHVRKTQNMITHACNHNIVVYVDFDDNDFR